MIGRQVPPLLTNLPPTSLHILPFWLHRYRLCLFFDRINRILIEKLLKLFKMVERCSCSTDRDGRYYNYTLSTCRCDILAKLGGEDSVAFLEELGKIGRIVEAHGEGNLGNTLFRLGEQMSRFSKPNVLNEVGRSGLGKGFELAVELSTTQVGQLG